MLKANWINKILDKAKVPYQELHHDVSYTSQEIAQKEHISGHQVSKVVVVIADGKPYGLVLPASKKVLAHRVREVLNSTYVRLATEEEIRSYCNDCELGASPPLPHWPNVKFLMDNSMRFHGEILLQGGTHADAVKLQFDDWFNLVKPEVAQFSIGREDFPSRISYRDEEEGEGLWF